MRTTWIGCSRPPPTGQTSLKSSTLFPSHRNDSFVTMLAPLRDHFHPKDPLSSPLLCMTKERYPTWMSVEINPNNSGFQESQWITLEDVNVEYLLDVFITVDPRPRRWLGYFIGDAIAQAVVKGLQQAIPIYQVGAIGYYWDRPELTCLK